MFDQYGLEPIFSVGWGPFVLQRMGHPVPEGILDNFYFGRGRTEEGGKVVGEFSREGWGRIVMRTDGVGIIEVRATLETTEGALISVKYHGRVDLGEDGYQRYLEQGFPHQRSIPLPMAVHFHTTYPNYLWLNRLQCLAIGLIEPAREIVAYDVYGVRYKNSRNTGEHAEAGDDAASARASACISAGQRFNTEPKFRLSVLTRIYCSRWAPRVLHGIC